MEKKIVIQKGNTVYLLVSLTQTHPDGKERPLEYKEFNSLAFALVRSVRGVPVVLNFSHLDHNNFVVEVPAEIPEATYALCVSGRRGVDKLRSLELIGLEVTCNNADVTLPTGEIEGVPSYGVNMRMQIYHGLALAVDDDVIEGSENAVTGGAVYRYLGLVEDQIQGAVDDAHEAAGLARTEAEEAHEAAGTAQSWADAAQKAATKANTGAKAAEEAAKNVGNVAEHADSAAKAAEELTETVRNEWDVIKKDAWNSVEALNTVGQEAKNTFEGMAEEYSQNEDARGQEFAKNETYRKQTFLQMQRGMTNDYAANEQERERKSNAATNAANSAARSATDATQQVNAAVQKASNVNAVLNGDELTVTDQNGQSVTRNVRGPKGDSITMFPNVTIFGQPRIQESQISGFTANDYVQFPFLVDFAGRPWQIDCAITTGADISQQHNVFDSAFGLALAIIGGKFVLAMSSNGTSWNLGATSGTHSILANYTYCIRITWDGAQYKLSASINKVNWIDDIIVTSSESLASKQIVIGKSLDNAHIFNGSINMSEARLTISGKIVWEGMDDAGLATRMAIDMSNIDEEGKQRVNQIVNDGEVGEKLSELEEETEILQIQTSDSDMTTLPTLCGQPMMLFGAGTPQESIVPDNWKQYDPATGEGYQWNGLPSALGQVYINTAVTTNGRYTAVENGYGNLKWVNF